jgi:MSHA pilin protein MshC
MPRKLTQSTGFTLIELVMVIVILSILSITVAPKFFDNSIFQARGFADQMLATLRYAQKSAIAQHRFFCVTFTPNSVSLKIDKTPITEPDQTTDCINENVVDLTGESRNITAPSGIRFLTIPSDFYFNALGKPSVNTSGVIDTTTITVEVETGYVHQ